jgi:anti-sigma factor RsiW
MKWRFSGKRLSAFMDKELSDGSSRAVERRLGDSPEARGLLHDFEKVDNLVRALPRIDPGADFASRVSRAATRAPAPAEARTLRCGLHPKFSLERFFESLFAPFDAGGRPEAHPLDEFGDFPPLSMGAVYFQLIEPAKRGC